MAQAIRSLGLAHKIVMITHEITPNDGKCSGTASWTPSSIKSQA